MKLKNRKGSTLALTIMIFAVLMIFATFTLGFMVTENKQAMYHQNKTQAYYIAKSGADIADAALRKQLRSLFNTGTEVDVNDYIQILDGVELNLVQDDTVQLLGADSLIVETYLAEVNGNEVLIVDSEAMYKGVTSSVKKALTSTLGAASVLDKTFNWDGQPIVATSGAWSEDKNKSDKLPEKYAKIVGENSMFKPYIFPNREWNLPEDVEMEGLIYLNGLVEDESDDAIGIINFYNTSVIINSDLTISENVKEINFYGNLTINGDVFVNGETAINIKNSLVVDDILEINKGGDPSELIFHVFNIDGSEESLLIDMVSPHGAEIYSNFYINDGKTTIILKKSKLVGSIVSNDKYTDEVKDGGNRSDEPIPILQEDYNVLIVSTESSGQIDFSGTIWAPDSYVVVGGSVLESFKAGIIQDGMVLGKYVEVEGNNTNLNYKDYLDPLLENALSNGTTTPIEIEEEIEIRALEFQSIYLDGND